ncbi:hypothetical protein ACOJBM_01085 [Rhizobium beringeri]
MTYSSLTSVAGHQDNMRASKAPSSQFSFRSGSATDERLHHFHWSRKEHADCLVLVTTLAEFEQQDLIDIVDQDILSGNPYPEALIIIAPADAAPGRCHVVGNLTGGG